jgi:hypothetical protein
MRVEQIFAAQELTVVTIVSNDARIAWPGNMEVARRFAGQTVVWQRCWPLSTTTLPIFHIGSEASIDLQFASHCLKAVCVDCRGNRRRAALRLREPRG